MFTRDFHSNQGTIKSPKDMRGKICLQPFTNVDIHSNHGIRCCSESWMPAWIGDFSSQSIMEIWNGETIRAIRASVLDGSYAFCDWHQCPFYCNDGHYLFTREELEHPEGLAPVRAERVAKNAAWIAYILAGKVEVDIPPANYNLAYDETCNLACPSCRKTTRVIASGPEFDERLGIHRKVLAEVAANGFGAVGRFNVTGAGEPFSSKIFTDFLYRFDGSKYPRLDINLQTNGQLLTPEAWDKMRLIHGNLNEVIVSLDAACGETYRQIRLNGSFDRLLENIAHLAEQRRAGRIRRLMLAFVVQKNNFLEMADAIRIGKSFGVDLFIFNLLNDWMSWSPEEYEANAVWKSYHPDYPRFVEALSDPIFDDPIVDLGNMTEYRRTRSRP